MSRNGQARHVSILVVVESALRVDLNLRAAFDTYGVSILVVVESALRDIF